MANTVWVMLSEPTNQHIALIIISAFGFLQLMSVLLFWQCHLRHHQSHPVYRIRHPKFWIMCLCLPSFDITFKAIITYLRLRSYISIPTYVSLNQIGVLLMGDVLLARGFVLWYTIKCQQYEQNILFESVLLESKPQLKSHPCLSRYEKHMSKPFQAFGVFQCLCSILALVGGILAFTVGTRVAKHYIITVVMLFWCVGAFLVYGTWHTRYKLRYKTNTNDDIEINTRFMDYFNFRSEFTLFWLNILIFIPLRSWCAVHFRVDANGEYANTGLVILAFLTLVSLCIPILIQTIVPYWTYTSKKSSIHTSMATAYNPADVTLFDVLRDRHAFFLFVNHTVQELNLENISCLIAIYQFKKIKTTHDDTLSDVSIPMMIGRGNEGGNSSDEMGDTVPDLVNVTSRVETPTLRSSLSSHTSAKDIKFYTHTVLELPWDDLPLTQCTSNMRDSKYAQANKIYEKYFTFGTIHTVNIAGVVRNHLSQAFWMLQERECSESDVLKVFDVVLPNVCSNLENTMDRFRSTKEFQSFTDINDVPSRNEWAPLQCVET